MKPFIKINERDLTEKFCSLKCGNKVVIECYHGVDYSQIIEKFSKSTLICIDDYFLHKEEYLKLTESFITSDRVFGKMNNFSINDLVSKKKLQKLQSIFDSEENIVVYGVGASLLNGADTTIYVDIPRWEIQKKYRKGLPNLNRTNCNDENITKFKIGYFLDWRICDEIKKNILFDYYVEGVSEFKVLSAKNYIDGVKKVASNPFRLVPYFDPGIWGGDWMKNEFLLPENGSNYAWSFDGVVEENSVIMKFGESEIEIPAINVLFLFPKYLIGEKIISTYGVEWPIRFDYLDTYNGDNLSVQVHPKKEYIYEKYGMNYTQDESYYFIKCTNESKVYLGLKNNVDKKKFIDALTNSETSLDFEVDKYINSFKVQEHDHVSIPAGTIHCSGKNSVVLEISSTPYIFTYKLWDWGRLDNKGIARPLHIKDGINNIDFSMTADFVEEELISRYDNELDIQKTGLYESEPIEVYRYKIIDELIYEKTTTPVMGNLVSGKKLRIITNGSITMDINFGETFIIPACVTEIKFLALSGTDNMIVLANIKNEYLLH